MAGYWLSSNNNKYGATLSYVDFITEEKFSNKFFGRGKESVSKCFGFEKKSK